MDAIADWTRSRAKIEIAGETKIASDGRERARWVKTRECGGD